MAESMTKGLLIFICVCGVLLFACGLANAIAGFIWLDYADYELFKFGGDGLWSGLALLVNSAFGVAVFCRRNIKVVQHFVVLSMLVFLLSSLQAWLSSVTYANVKENLNTLPFCKAKDQISSSCRILNGQGRIDAIFFTIRIASTIGAVVCIFGSIVISVILHGRQQSDATVMEGDGNEEP